MAASGLCLSRASHRLHAHWGMGDGGIICVIVMRRFFIREMYDFPDVAKAGFTSLEKRAHPVGRHVFDLTY